MLTAEAPTKALSSRPSPSTINNKRMTQCLNSSARIAAESRMASIRRECNNPNQLQLKMMLNSQSNRCRSLPHPSMSRHLVANGKYILNLHKPPKIRTMIRNLIKIAIRRAKVSTLVNSLHSRSRMPKKSRRMTRRQEIVWRIKSRKAAETLGHLNQFLVKLVRM